MFRLFAFVVSLLPVASGAFAVCNGKDLRLDLSAESSAEIRAALEAEPFNQGNHWIARRGDQAIHVIGTYHLTDPRMDDLVSRLAAVLTSADILLLEVDQDETARYMASVQNDMSAMMLTSGPTLIDIMGEDRWAAFSEILRENQVPPVMAAKMRPWLLSQLLAIPACVRGQKNIDNGLDRRLEALATSQGLPVGSLETMEELLDLMNAQPLEDQVNDLLITAEMTGGSADMLTTTVESYFDEDVLFGLDTMRRDLRATSPFPEAEFDLMWDGMMQTLLVHRHDKWMPRLAEYNQKTIVVAVGALHLPGEAGVLNLLSKQGYRLERAAF